MVKTAPQRKKGGEVGTLYAIQQEVMSGTVGSGQVAMTGEVVLSPSNARTLHAGQNTALSLQLSAHFSLHSPTLTSHLCTWPFAHPAPSHVMVFYC